MQNLAYWGGLLDVHFASPAVLTTHPQTDPFHSEGGPLQIKLSRLGVCSQYGKARKMYAYQHIPIHQVLPTYGYGVGLEFNERTGTMVPWYSAYGIVVETIVIPQQFMTFVPSRYDSLA